MIINVLMVLLVLTLKFKIQEFTSKILPSYNLASTWSTAIPEVVLAVKGVLLLSLFNSASVMV